MSMLRECDSCMRAGGALQAARQCCRPPKKPRPPINCPPGPREPEDSGAPMSSGPAGGSGALVYQLGTLRNCAECGGIELSQILADPECDYALDSPFVMVNRPGTYLVIRGLSPRRGMRQHGVQPSGERGDAAFEHRASREGRLLAVRDLFWTGADHRYVPHGRVPRQPEGDPHLGHLRDGDGHAVVPENPIGPQTRRSRPRFGAAPRFYSSVFFRLPVVAFKIAIIA